MLKENSWSRKEEEKRLNLKSNLNVICQRETVYIMVKLQVSLLSHRFFIYATRPPKVFTRSNSSFLLKHFNLSLSYFKNSTWSYFISLRIKFRAGIIHNFFSPNSILLAYNIFLVQSLRAFFSSPFPSLFQEKETYIFCLLWNSFFTFFFGTR